MIIEKNVTIAHKVLKRLEGIDWDFEALSSKGDITSLHPYPARFIPSIPETIIKAVKYYQDDLKVLDPFAGCGTVLSESLSVGAQSVGIDVNGLANFLQTAYSTKYNDKDLIKFQELTNKVSEAIKQAKHFSKVIDIPNLEHWFDESTIQLVSKAVEVVNLEQSSKMAKVFGLLSISRVLVTLSRQKSDTQYVAIEKSLSPEQKVDVLINSFRTVYERFYDEKDKHTESAICIHGDSREKETYKGVNGINLVITSPPYPNAYEYWLYHKYRMYWLGMDPIYSRTNEIGVRPHYSGSGKKNEWDFYQDIHAVLSNIDKVTTKDALQFWVVGESIIKGKKVNNSQIVINAANELGWNNIATFHRNINRRRSSFQGIGNKELEDIIVLSR